MRLGEEHYVDGGTREILPSTWRSSASARGTYSPWWRRPAAWSRHRLSSKGLLEIARRVSADIGPDETRRKETDAAGWGRRVTLVAPELDVHDALTVDPELIAASIDYGWMRAADLLLGLGPEAQAVSAQIARIRARIRACSGSGAGLPRRPAPVPASELLDPTEAAAVVDREVTRLEDLLDRRRRDGLPLAPAWSTACPSRCAGLRRAPGGGGR